MQNLQQFFIGNPIWTLIISIIVAVVIAVFFYRKGRKFRKPTYYIKSHNLVIDFTSNIDKLQLLYGNTPIKNLTVSKIGFWNEGELIEAKDTVEDDPLRIESLGECQILDATVIKEINTLNKFRINFENSKSVTIYFDFLDKGQGGAIQVIHTGEGTSDIKVDGYIKGAGKPQPSYTQRKVLDVLDKIFLPSKKPQPAKPPPAKTRRDMAIFSFFVAFIMLIMVLSDRSTTSLIFGLPTIFVFVYFGYTLLRRRVPKGLEIVEEEEN